MIWTYVLVSYVAVLLEIWFAHWQGEVNPNSKNLIVLIWLLSPIFFPFVVVIYLIKGLYKLLGF